MNAFSDSRVEAFLAVRDLEYRYRLDDLAQDTTCYSKAGKLKAALAEFGIASRHICCRYNWSETGLPRELIARAPSVEGQHHYLEVLVPETRTWVAVDPTWDAKLRTAGFPVADWDGINPTILGVKPFATFLPEMSERIFSAKAKIPRSTWDQLHREIGSFYNDVNSWIAAQRRPVPGLPRQDPPKGHHA